MKLISRKNPQSSLVKCTLIREVMINNFWEYLVVRPIILALGLVGNTISFVVFSRAKLRKMSLNLFLRLIAVTDSLALLCATARLIFIYVTDGNDFQNVSAFACKIYYYVTLAVYALQP